MAGMRPGQAKGPSVQRPSGGGGGGAPATATFATIANEAATLPNSRRLVAGANVSFVDAVAGSTLTISASGGPIASPYAKELWPFATNETESAISQAGTGSGNNSGTRAFGFISEGTVTISQMVIWFSQVTGSNFRLGLYDAGANRIAQTSRFAPAVGINVVPLIAPVVLTGAKLYYMALWTDDTTFEQSLFGPFRPVHHDHFAEHAEERPERNADNHRNGSHQYGPSAVDDDFGVTKWRQ